MALSVASAMPCAFARRAATSHVAGRVTMGSPRRARQWRSLHALPLLARTERLTDTRGDELCAPALFLDAAARMRETPSSRRPSHLPELRQEGVSHSHRSEGVRLEAGMWIAGSEWMSCELPT